MPYIAIVRYFKYLELPDPHHYCQATLWSLREPCTKDLLQQAINAIAQQHDLLRVVYKDDGLFVRPADAAPILQEFAVNSTAEITELCGKLQASINMAESLLNIALIYEGGCDYLFMAAHHLIIDGVSWRIIASDIEVALSALRRGEKTASSNYSTQTYSQYGQWH